MPRFPLSVTQQPIHRLLALCGLATALLAPLGAQASCTYCRTDPVVTLSDGTRVTLFEDVYDTATDISSITYQLHIPVGVRVTSISYSGAVPSTAQHITTYADDNPGNYDGYTVVTTATSSISVTAYMSANNTVSCQTSGHSGQTLHSHLHV